MLEIYILYIILLYYIYYYYILLFLKDLIMAYHRYSQKHLFSAFKIKQKLSILQYIYIYVVRIRLFQNYSSCHHSS